MRLIDADAMKDRVKKYMSVFDKKDWRGICEMLNNAPTIEAEPIRHGRWQWVDGVRCSICNHKLQTTGLPSYCPNCGAKMDDPTQKSVGKALKVLEALE